MPTIGTILNQAAAYMKRSSVNDFIINTVDTGYLAMNAARQTLERINDFHYSETDVTLSIASTGSLITNAVAATPGSVLVTGTPTPDVTGTFTQIGTYNSATLYYKLVSGTDYYLYWTGSVWRLSTAIVTSTGNAWTYAGSIGSPAGTYTFNGTYTGTPTVEVVTSSVSVKRVCSVLLPVAGSQYFPIEFLTNDEWLGRLRRSVGRSIYNSAKTSGELGVYSGNPICYQQGQTLNLVPASQFTFPVSAKLSVVRWMPDYANSTDTDYFTTYASDFLLWQGILELNKYWVRFAPKQEGNIDEPEVTAFRDAALQAVLKWDGSLVNGTSSPEAIMRGDAPTNRAQI